MGVGAGLVGGSLVDLCFEPSVGCSIELICLVASAS